VRSLARAVVRPTPWIPWDGAAASNKQIFLDTPTGFARANSISDVSHDPVHTLWWTTFGTLIFFDDLTLDDEGVVLGGGGVSRDGADNILDGAA
jgi:hypothetical protein